MTASRMPLPTDVCLHVAPPWPPAGETLPLPREKAHHALHVLRLERGASVCLLDGEGNTAAAVFEMQGKNRADVRLLEAPRPSLGSVAPMDVILGLPRHETMDTVVRQACELGVDRILPVISARSVIPARVARQKADHWRRVAAAACEQCRRARFPEILPARRLDEVLEEPFEGRARLFFWEEAAGEDSVWPVDSAAGLVAAIGCEGGWTPEEADAFRSGGFATLSLGPLILRVDTAFCAVCAMGVHRLRTRPVR